MRKNGGKLILGFITVLVCLAIVWSSCKKKSSVASCNYYVCLNGGYCSMDTAKKMPKCICPVGYEGYNCNTLTVEKYMDTWDMQQIITGSDSMAFQDDTMYYPVMLRKTATLTTFFIYNFSNKPYYSSILCTLDSSDSRYFNIDTISAKQLFYDNYHLVKGSGVLITNDTIKADLITRHLSATSNWIRDTFKLTMTRRK